MPAFLYLFLLPLPFPQLAAIADDPAPGILRSNTEARGVDCEVLPLEAAQARYPGQVEAEPPRGSFVDTRAMVCRHRLFPNGERVPRDEAILSRLSETVRGLVGSATASAPPKLTWQVEAHYPDAAMASKIAFAAKVALVTRGQAVTDRVPVLAAGDVLVIAAQEPGAAWRLACARAFAEGSLKPGEVLLGLALVDARETTLHAGLCIDGDWRWVE